MQINVYGIRGFPDVQGGAEIHCQELYIRFEPYGIEFKVFRRTPYIRATHSGHGAIRFRDLWAIRNKYLEALLHSFACCIETIIDGPDLVHVHNIGPSLTLPLIKLFRIPAIVTYHSTNYEHSKWNGFSRLVLKAAEKLVLHLADAIIFVSPVQKEQIAAQHDRAHVIPNGVPRYSRVNKSVLERFGLERENYVLSVGRIVREKRLHDILHAMSALQTTIPLVIAGSYDNDKAYWAELLSYKDKLGEQVVFTGLLPKEDVAGLYDGAYCLVLSSESEGMPLVLLEAMSFGVCPLVSDIEANMHVISTGKHGYFFEVGNVDDLAEKLGFMLSNPEEVQTKGAQAREHVRQTYNWERVAEATYNMYCYVLSENT